jgi:hypothetical protein
MQVIIIADSVVEQFGAYDSEAKAEAKLLEIESSIPTTIRTMESRSR